MTRSCGYDTISSVVLLIQLKCTSKSENFILNYDLPVFWLGQLLKGKAGATTPLPNNSTSPFG
jgi:hypothetical protein